MARPWFPERKADLFLAIPKPLGAAAPFLAMAFLLIILFHKALFLGDVLVAADTLQLNLPWASAGRELTIQNWYPADSIYLFYPWQLYMKEMLDRKDVPLWNPYSFGGHPFLANSQSGVFDPFNVLFLIFDFNTAYNLRLILQLYAAGIFAYLFLRIALGISRFGALMGGVFYMLNGVFIVWLEWRWMVGGGLWLPLILLFLERSWERNSYLYAVLAGISLAASFLGGMVQHSLAMVLTILLYAAIRAGIRYREAPDLKLFLRPFLFAALAHGVAVPLAAVQLLPTFELLSESQRDFNLASNLVEWFKLFPKNAFLSLMFLGDFVNPYWTGNVQSLDFRTLITWPTTHGNIIEYQGYVGLSALVLAGIALGFKRSRHSAVFLCMASLILFLSLATPVNLILYFRWLFAYAFAVAMLAGLGADYLTSSQDVETSLGKANVLLMKLLGLLVVLVVVGNAVLYLWGASIRDFGRAYLEARITNYLPYTNDVGYIFGRLEALYRNYHFTSPSMYLPVVTLVALIAIFSSYRRRIVSRGLLRVALFCLAAFELLHFGITFTPSVRESEVFPPTRVVDFLRQDQGLYRILPIRQSGTDPPVMHPNTHMPYGLQSVGGYDGLFPKRYAELMRLIGGEGIGSLGRKFSQAVILSDYENKLLDMLNVKYVLVDPKRQITDQRFEKAFEGPLTIYRNKGALPRAFVVSEARVIKDKVSLLATLMSKGFEPRREVLLESHPPVRVSGSSGTGVSAAEVLAYSPHRVVIRARLAQDGFLVLGDSYFPGWRAWVNGSEQPVYRANYILRAVPVGAGESTVEFSYRPHFFKIGTWISVSTALALSGVLAYLLYSALVTRFAAASSGHK